MLPDMYWPLQTQACYLQNEPVNDASIHLKHTCYSTTERLFSVFIYEIFTGFNETARHRQVLNWSDLFLFFESSASQWQNMSPLEPGIVTIRTRHCHRLSMSWFVTITDCHSHCLSWSLIFTIMVVTIQTCHYHSYSLWQANTHLLVFLLWSFGADKICQWRYQHCYIWLWKCDKTWLGVVPIINTLLKDIHRNIAHLFHL